MRVFNSKHRRAAIFAGCVIALTAILWEGFNTRRNTDSTPISSERPETTSVTKRERPLAPVAGPAYNAGQLKSSGSVDWAKCSLSIADAGQLLQGPMTPELAQILLARVKSETKGIQDRATLSSIILNALCTKGYSAEAWQFLEESPGSVRSTEIGILVQSDKGPTSALVSRLDGLVDPEERMQAFRALMNSRPAEIVNLDFSKIPVISPQDKVGVASGIMFAMKGAGKNQDPAMAEALLQKSIDLVRSEKLDVNNLSTILKNDIGIAPFQKWRILEGLKSGFSTSDIDRICAEAVPSMIKTDLDKTMDILCKDPLSKYSVPILSSAISTMYDADPEQANNWVLTHLPTLDPATAQRIVVRVAQVAIKNGEFETAQQWTNRLLNPGVKQQVSDQINEEKAARQQNAN